MDEFTEVRHIQTPEVDAKKEFLRQQSIEALKKMDILSETEEGDLAVDIDNLRNFSTRNFKETFPSESNGGMSAPYVRDNAGSTEKLFTEVLAGLEVYKKGEEELGKKKLVFIPETAEDLSDIAKMEDSWASLGDIGITTSWEGRYPSDNPDLNLSKMEVHLPYLIYRHSRGQRDEQGALWVDKVAGDPESGRQKISANWLKRNGFKGTTEFPVDQNISSLIDEYGAEWVRQDLLKPTDFPQSNLSKTEWKVQDQGRLEIKNVAYWVGTEYSDGRAVQIAPGELLIYDKDGQPAAILNSNIDPQKLSETTVVDRGKGRKALYVNKPAVQITPINSLGEFSNLQLGGNEKIRERVSYKREFDNFLNFKDSLSEEEQKNLESFSLQDQINIARSIRNIGTFGDENAGAEARDFLDKTGRVGMRILAEAEARGGLDLRLLDLKNLEEEKREKLLQDYQEFRDSIENLGNTLIDQAQAKKLNITSIALVHRVKEAMLSRSTDFLLADMNQNSDEMSKHAQALSFVDAVINGRVDYKFQPGEDKQTNMRQGRYVLEDGSQLNIVVRPEATEGAQARISFVYLNKSGERTDLRLDNDEHGLSVDIARRKTQLHDTLTDLGKSHHTQAIFEKGLKMDSAEFKKLAETMPVILGW